MSTAQSKVGLVAGHHSREMYSSSVDLVQKRRDHDGTNSNRRVRGVIAGGVAQTLL